MTYTAAIGNRGAKPLGSWRDQAIRYMEGISHPVCGGVKPLGLWRDKATRSMKGQSRSVYGGQSRSVYGWTNLKATLHIEGQSRWVYGRASPLLFLFVSFVSTWLFLYTIKCLKILTLLIRLFNHAFHNGVSGSSIAQGSWDHLIHLS